MQLCFDFAVDVMPDENQNRKGIYVLPVKTQLPPWYGQEKEKK